MPKFTIWAPFQLRFEDLFCLASISFSQSSALSSECPFYTDKVLSRESTLHQHFDPLFAFRARCQFSIPYSPEQDVNPLFDRARCQSPVRQSRISNFNPLFALRARSISSESTSIFWSFARSITINILFFCSIWESPSESCPFRSISEQAIQEPCPFCSISEQAIQQPCPFRSMSEQAIQQSCSFRSISEQVIQQPCPFRSMSEQAIQQSCPFCSINEQAIQASCPFHSSKGTHHHYEPVCSISELSKRSWLWINLQLLRV